jgi:hypothetical protein
MRDYLSRFAYPGQDPNDPVTEKEVNPVTVFGFLPTGFIRTRVSLDGLTITNITEPVHLLYDGQVERRAVQAPDGSWYIATTGIGNNFVTILSPINQTLAPIQFNTFDADMLDYILANQ